MPTLPVTCENFSLAVLKHAIQKLRSNKAFGDDEITSEMLKVAADATLQNLLTPMNDVWVNEDPPQQWKDNIIVKLSKKGIPQIVTTGEVLHYYQ
jgi:hypothetical protein